MNSQPYFASMAPSMRDPAWRYLQALESVQSGRVVLSAQADKNTVLLARYLRREDECTTDAARLRHRKQQPALAMALEVGRDPTSVRAAQLEALVLAREPAESIAGRCEMTESTVWWYRKCFFSIGRYLDNAAYVYYQLIEPELRKPDYEAGLRFLLKFYGYFCGVKALELFFWMDTASLRKGQWQSPGALVQKMACGADLRLAIRMMSQENVTHVDFGGVRNSLEDALNRLRDQHVGSWPKSFFDAHMAQLIS